ncbi:MAG: hypothetical protein HY681_15255 [Chloroflexi bacterium]|nr:hypothetical protein [Chloroflexota bacterium]
MSRETRKDRARLLSEKLERDRRQVMQILDRALGKYELPSKSLEELRREASETLGGISASKMLIEDRG